MDKLQICRICLAENVTMHVVVSDTLHDLYEKLTDNPFVTEDCRPTLACFICCAQLKKCYRFQKKCLEAEEQFARMMLTKEDYEIKPLINQNQFELFHGFIRTPIDTISIVDVDKTESIVVKDELPADCERLEIDDDIIEPKIEYESNDDLKIINKYDNYLDLNDTPLHNSESDSKHDIPLLKVKTEVEEQEISKMEQETDNLKPVNIYDTYLDIKDTPLHHSESDSEDVVPLLKVKTEVEEQEVTKMEQETDREFAAKKRKLETTRAETMTAEQKEKDTKTIEENHDPPRVQNNVGYCRIKSKGEVNIFKDSKPFKCHICLRGFSSKGRRQLHILTHDREESKAEINSNRDNSPNKCNVCGHEFCNNSKLKRHYRIHTGEKPYHCKICQYKTNTNYNLKLHNRIHTADHPFKCDECLSSFLQKGRLLLHKELHHPVKTIKP